MLKKYYIVWLFFYFTIGQVIKDREKQKRDSWRDDDIQFNEEQAEKIENLEQNINLIQYFIEKSGYFSEAHQINETKTALFWDIEKTLFEMTIMQEVDQILKSSNMNSNQRMNTNQYIENAITEYLKRTDRLDYKQQKKIKDFITRFTSEYKQISTDQRKTLTDDLRYFQQLTQEEQNILTLDLQENISQYFFTTNDTVDQIQDTIIQQVDQLIMMEKQKQTIMRTNTYQSCQKENSQINPRQKLNLKYIQPEDQNDYYDNWKAELTDQHISKFSYDYFEKQFKDETSQIFVFFTILFIIMVLGFLYIIYRRNQIKRKMIERLAVEISSTDSKIKFKKSIQYNEICSGRLDNHEGI